MAAQPKRAISTDTVEVLAALGDATRLSIVDRLAVHSPRTATQLGHGLPVSRQAVAKHLRVLADAGLVTDEKSGRERLYSLDAERIRQARQTLDEIAAGWDRALARLRSHVDKTGDSQ